MKKDAILTLVPGFLVIAAPALLADGSSDSNQPPPVPAFSTNYMDRTVSPGDDFFHFADGQWLKDNPVPPDKSRWASFSELAERNWYLIHSILEDAEQQGESLPAHSPRREVGDFFASVMDTNQIEKLGIAPLADELKKIDAIQSPKDLFALLAEFHQSGVGGLFGAGFGPDARNSAIYAVELEQGGLSLPDRDYYLKDTFAEKLKKFHDHVAKMFTLLGEASSDAAAHADTVIALETELAKASRTRVELRDPVKNYNKFVGGEFPSNTPALAWEVYFADRDIGSPAYEIVGQPEFFTALNGLVQDRPLSDWRIYLRWHLVHGAAPFLPAAFEDENFNFYGKVLSGQPEQEPRWKRGAHIIDGSIGEALGQLYVEQYFPPEARKRMNELVENLKSVFRGRLAKVSWMTDATRAKALAKFAKFTQKIGYPSKFRDYSSIELRRDDLIGNVRRAAQFDSHREIVRIGKPVDRTEWGMTPETVNAYFSPEKNEIVFPAGILQPPFFDLKMDDAVNYGAIGVVIGHEMTHGYDDEGRKFDAEGNLNDWWTPDDAKAFEARAQLVVDEYSAFEVLPGVHVNGKLTLGENLADLGGVHIAYEALERDLAKYPAKRKIIDGFTPEQRFFISFAQIWRTNVRDAEAQRLVTVDPHSPGRFRAYGPLLNVQEFYDAFDIKPGSPVWLPPEKRAIIW
ncbi:MAG: M13 family metallopeptidase [Verrucomicrobiota bacterium]|jgi:putative endopeptidase